MRAESSGVPASAGLSKAIAAYSSKAGNYARYRWRYAPAAIEALARETGLSSGSVVADVGSGTGILTQELLALAGKVFAVEPNLEMRAMAESDLSRHPAFRSVAATAEATTLPDHSVDLITVAQAIHWFDPEPTRRELLRILKPGGWLAVLQNCETFNPAREAMSELLTEAHGWLPEGALGRPPEAPLQFFYGGAAFKTLTFPLESSLDWQAFRGSLLSAASAPSEDHPKYAQFERAARRIFERCSASGLLEMQGLTELRLGQMA